MLEHMTFLVLYVIPNMSLCDSIPTFGASSQKTKRIQEIKVEMIKKVIKFNLKMCRFMLKGHLS
jgi:Ser-tRNA(Ala) deacylase AlaX